MGVHRAFRAFLVAGVTVVGGMIALSMATSVTLNVIRSATESKRKKSATPCQPCRGKGFYLCRLCKGNTTIEWSPLYDPIAINPCLCPTCDGHGVQRCLNCLGKGYF
ncbi:hypothetical protein Nepgr_029171 [Nepenthes gracilis]|uniref:Uncharacterized protein n=1 Tax=Nepenthes gracilis TaxID=150966 RepID=A0AAD3Y318_NEPGR|nr:hypothetical protein Nepgr_029171 [Nepenthes gracilis]